MHEPVVFDTHLLRHLVYALLAREQNGRGQDTLSKLAADTLVQTLDALLAEDGEHTIERRLVPLRMCLACLEAALHDTGRD